MRLLLGVAALAFVSACAAAPDTTSASLAPAGAKTEKAVKATKTCRRVPVMGSNMAKKVCSTPEEWAAYDAKGREGVDQFDRERDNAGGSGAGERMQ